MCKGWGIAPLILTLTLDGRMWTAPCSDWFITKKKLPRHPLNRRPDGPQGRYGHFTEDTYIIYMFPQQGIEWFLERRTRSLITVAITLSWPSSIFRFEYVSLSVFLPYETIGQQAELTYTYVSVLMNAHLCDWPASLTFLFGGRFLTSNVSPTSRAVSTVLLTCTQRKCKKFQTLA